MTSANNPNYAWPKVSGEALALWAENTGALYALHVAMAARDANVGAWRRHVDSVLVPRYIREIEPSRIDCAARDTAARCLMSYYHRHRIETERLAGVNCHPCRHGYQERQATQTKEDKTK